jgi:hypothetical protein
MQFASDIQQIRKLRLSMRIFDEYRPFHPGDNRLRQRRVQTMIIAWGQRGTGLFDFADSRVVEES